MTSEKEHNSLHLESEFKYYLSDDCYSFSTKIKARKEQLPLDRTTLSKSPSGDIFGLSQDVGMGETNENLLNPQVLILSTMGGYRDQNGNPIALGYHTGHWELDLLIKEAALELRKRQHLPYAAYCSDPCDGRTQGTNGMMDSLAYRNSAAEVMARLTRSLPLARGVLGIATCDKGLPAMMLTLAEVSDLPAIIIPGGVSLSPDEGEDAGTVQSIGARFSHGELSLEEAASLGCAACATPGGGCQFMGTAASAQVMAEALGLTLPHSALIPSGQKVWLEMAKHSSHALVQLIKSKTTLKSILTDDSIYNAMVVHAAFGASTNIVIHLAAFANKAGLSIPDVTEWEAINRNTPRIVDVLPNGPKNYSTAQVFLAGGVPEVMLHLYKRGLLKVKAKTVTGKTIEENLLQWEGSERRQRFKEQLQRYDQINSEDIIYSIDRSHELNRTLIFPKGNISPEGSVVKSSAIDKALFENGVYKKIFRARVFVSEIDAIKAVKSKTEDKVQSGEVIILLCRGPIAAGMPETAQLSIALKYTNSLKNIPLLTDGRFSGFTSGPCIGHIGPEAMAGGPVGKLKDGDVIEITLDIIEQVGSVNLIGSEFTDKSKLSIQEGDKILDERSLREDLHPAKGCPDSVRLWGALQQTGGGVWGGCVPNINEVIERLLK